MDSVPNPSRRSGPEVSPPASDHVGLDVRLDIAGHLREELGERVQPPQLLRRKVRADDPRSKTGEGFYVREDGEAVRPADEWAAGVGA